MPDRTSTGTIEVYLNADRTQAFASISPPQPRDSDGIVKELIERLGRSGVAYGIRYKVIEAALREVAETGRRIEDVLIAEGSIPLAGSDARLEWLVPESMTHDSLPRRADGLPDYFAFDPGRMVVAGQEIAAIEPAGLGEPGKTLGRPAFLVAPRPGKLPPVAAGPGVRLSADGRRYVAEVAGFLEVLGGHVTVHALRLAEGDVMSDAYELNCGIIITGDMTATNLRADGVVAVRGDCAGARIRARGDVVLMRAARSTIVADGDVYVLGGLLHCDVITRGRVIALDGASIFGGKIAAREGIEAADLGCEDRTLTRVYVGGDRWTGVRLEEVGEEIRAAELNVKKIAQALRSLGMLMTEQKSDGKKRLVQTLDEQRTHLERKIEELRGSKRGLMMAAKSQASASIHVSGRVHPGVQVGIRNATLAVESEHDQVSFHEAGQGRILMLGDRGQRTAA